MRIVQVCRTAPPAVGGLEHAVGELSRRLAERGHDVVLASFVPGDTPGVTRTRLRRIGPRRWPVALGLRAALAGADVVHVHAIDGLLDACLALARAPVGVSTHGGYFHTPRHRWLKELWLRTGTAASLRRAAAVWYSSEADRARFAPAGVDGPVETPGVDVARLLAVARRPVPGRVVLPGRIDVHKGQADALPGLAVLAAERPELRIRLLGPEAAPGQLARIRARAEVLGIGDRLEAVGALDRDAWAEELARAELAVFPSRAEGFGIAVVEALAAGVPSVLSDLPAHRAHDGLAAVVDFADPWAVAAACRGARTPDREALRPYDWEARVTAFEGRYLELLARGPRPAGGRG